MRRFLAVLVLAVPAAAQDVPVYRRHEAMASDLRAKTAVSVIGKSGEGRDILAVTIGGADADRRPALLVVGGVEGDGIAGSELAAAIAVELAGARDERTAKLLAGYTVYVIPRLNPDGIERFFASPRAANAGTARAWDEDRDGDVDEDGPEDLDGDGEIVLMRVEDASGEWVADATDAGLMRKPDPLRGERGAWKVFVEGRDTDGDGAWNEDGPGGIDLNSNFPWNYRMHGPRTGPFMVSELESRALADFIAAHPNIEAAFSFASNDNCIHQAAPALPPNPLPDPGSPVMGIDAGDLPYLAKAAEAYRAKIGGDRRDPSPLREGGVGEWLYFHRGILSLASPGWSVPWKAGEAKDLPHEDPKAREERWAHRWLRENRPGEWVEWHAFVNPDFPGKKVEIGGWKPQARLLPPVGELPVIAAKHGDFLRGLMEAFPRVGIRDAAVKKLGDGLYEVTATVFNDGLLPTALRQGERTRRARAVRVDLVADGLKVMSGQPVTLIPVLDARGGSKELLWVVNGAEGNAIELRVETDRAGTAVWKGVLK